MTDYHLRVDNAADVKFIGELLGFVCSSSNNAAGSRYSGEVGRWTELNLYKTSGCNFVCYRVEHTQWQGERNKYTCHICKDMSGVYEFFGHDWLAKDLYDEAGIESSVAVD